jgi:hypothetical protein
MRRKGQRPSNNLNYKKEADDYAKNKLIKDLIFNIHDRLLLFYIL